MSDTAAVAAEVVPSDNALTHIPSRGVPRAVCHSSVQEGAGVVLQIGDKDPVYSFVDVKRGARVRVGKSSVYVDALIGAEYGSFWEIDRGKLVAAPPAPLSEYFDDKTADLSFVPTANNSRLHDTNSSQKLGAEDMKTLRQEISGSEIVQLLAENSSTFASKTEFSQQKWIKKKKEKYCPRVRLLPVGAHAICTAYFIKFPYKVQGMRHDTLAQILHAANPRTDPNSCSVVVDQTGGLLTAAVAERQGGFGNILHLHPHAGANLLGVKYAQLMAHARENIHTLRMKFLRQLLEHRQNPSGTNAEPVAQPVVVEAAVESAVESVAAESKNKKKGERVTAPALPGAQYMPPARTVAQIMSIMQNINFSSLLIATDSALEPLADILIAALSPSASFVVYAQTSEPLAALYQRLRHHRLAVNMQLSETWFRNYQVLPNRTHPDMSMSGGGGYILIGTRLHAPEWTVQKIVSTFFAANGEAATSSEPLEAPMETEPVHHEQAEDDCEGTDDEQPPTKQAKLE